MSKPTNVKYVRYRKLSQLRDRASGLMIFLQQQAARLLPTASGVTAVADATLDRVTATAHGFARGTPVTFTNSGGVLPGGLVVGTTYFVIPIDANTIQVATSRQASVSSLALDITSVGTGTHTIARSATTGGILNLLLSGRRADTVRAAADIDTLT